NVINPAHPRFGVYMGLVITRAIGHHSPSGQPEIRGARGSERMRSVCRQSRTGWLCRLNRPVIAPAFADGPVARLIVERQSGADLAGKHTVEIVKTFRRIQRAYVKKPLVIHQRTDGAFIAA